MKHNILIIDDLGKVVSIRNFPDSFEARKYFREVIDPNAYYGSDNQIQLNYFEDPALLIDFRDYSVTVFPVNDLATILLIKDIARCYSLNEDFTLYYQINSHRILYNSHYVLLNSLLEPLEDSILKRRLTVPFN